MKKVLESKELKKSDTLREQTHIAIGGDLEFTLSR